nr:flagellar hook-length control protein FliK [Arthrobacter sp. C9C5]
MAANRDAGATPASALSAEAVTGPAATPAGASVGSNLPPSALAGSSSAPAVQTAPTTAAPVAVASIPPAASAAFAPVPAGVQAASSAPDAATTPAGGKAGPAATPRVPSPAVPLPATSATFNGSGAPTATPADVVTSGVVGVNKLAGPTRPAPDAVPLAAVPADGVVAAGAAALAAPGPASGPATPSAGTAAAASPAPAASPQPALQPQLAKPLFTLAGAPHGQHVMTLKLSPEDLGPLTVRAHIDGAGVRIELFAPADTGREALRAILPDLRKELADSGFGASLDVSDYSGPSGGGQDASARDAGHADSGGAGARNGAGSGGPDGRGEPRPGHRWDQLADEASLRSTRILNGPQTTLDILV